MISWQLLPPALRRRNETLILMRVRKITPRNSACLCVVKRACFEASELLISVNVIELEMKGSDGVLRVIVPEKWGEVVAN